MLCPRYHLICPSYPKDRLKTRYRPGNGSPTCLNAFRSLLLKCYSSFLFPPPVPAFAGGSLSGDKRITSLRHRIMHCILPKYCSKVNICSVFSCLSSSLCPSLSSDGYSERYPSVQIRDRKLNQYAWNPRRRRQRPPLHPGR